MVLEAAPRSSILDPLSNRLSLLVKGSEGKEVERRQPSLYIGNALSRIPILHPRLLSSIQVDDNVPNRLSDGLQRSNPHSLERLPSSASDEEQGTRFAQVPRQSPVAHLSYVLFDLESLRRLLQKGTEMLGHSMSYSSRPLSV